MKKIITLLFILSLSVYYAFGQAPKDAKQIETGIKQLRLSASYIGEVNLVVSRYEVSVGDWLGFLESKREQLLENSDSELLDSVSYHTLLTYFDFFITGTIQNKIAWNKIFGYYKLDLLEHSELGASSNYGEVVGEFDKDYYEDEYRDLRTNYQYTGVWIPFTLTHTEIDDKYENNLKKVSDSLRYFMDFPIYGISYELALEFANWSAEQQNKSSLNKSKLQLKGRLMTVQEYETLLKKAGPRVKENQTVYPDSVNSLGCLLMNIIPSEKCTSTENKNNLFGKNPVSVPIWSYNPDNYGIYNIYGNMAEMTMTKGVAKGGCFENYGKEIYYDQSQEYLYDENAKPINWLGFRIVYEVK